MFYLDRLNGTPEVSRPEPRRTRKAIQYQYPGETLRTSVFLEGFQGLVVPESYYGQNGLSNKKCARSCRYCNRKSAVVAFGQFAHHSLLQGRTGRRERS